MRRFNSMLNFSARRVALTVTCAAVMAVAGGCGARPTATAGDQVIAAPQTTSAASSAEPTTPPQDSTTPPETVNPGAPPMLDPTALVQAAASVEPNTTLGAVVFDRTTGYPVLSVNADRQFRSASLVKLLIAIDALQHGADAKEQERIVRMLSMSDDNIANAMWVKYGPDIVGRMASTIGLQATESPEQVGKWGETKVTANDMVRVYRYITESLPIESRTMIIDALAQAPEFAADNFDQYFGIPDGLNSQRAIKQGWGNNSSAMVLHSTGLVGPDWQYIVILLTEHPLGSGWRTSANSVTAAAHALGGIGLRFGG